MYVPGYINNSSQSSSQLLQVYVLLFLEACVQFIRAQQMITLHGTQLIHKLQSAFSIFIMSHISLCRCAAVVVGTHQATGTHTRIYAVCVMHIMHKVQYSIRCCLPAHAHAARTRSRSSMHSACEHTCRTHAHAHMYVSVYFRAAQHDFFLPPPVALCMLYYKCSYFMQECAPLVGESIFRDIMAQRALILL